MDELLQTNNSGHISRTTLTLLEMLKAYDKIQNQMLLEAATRLADWLNQVDETDVSLINLLQCYYRKREMDEEEIFEKAGKEMIFRSMRHRKMQRKIIGRCKSMNILEAQNNLKYPYNTIFRVNHPSSKEKEQSAPYFLQNAIIERVPIPCSFSFDSGMPSFEKTMSSLQGFDISNISLGL